MNRRLCIWILFPLPLLAGCIHGGSIPVDMTTLSQSRALENEKSLDTSVSLDFGAMEIFGMRNPGLLYSIDLEYDRNNYDAVSEYTPMPDGRGKLSVRMDSLHNSDIRKEIHANRIRIGFADSIPLELRLAAGVGDSRLSLSGLQLSGLNIESGVGAARISVYEPNPIECKYVHFKSGVGSLEADGLANLNFRELEFEGGVGGATLDFSGEWKQNADIRIVVGVGGVRLRIPREVGVEVEATKHYLGGIQLNGFKQRGNSQFSPNYDSAAYRISIRATTGIGGLKIDWI